MQPTNVQLEDFLVNFYNVKQSFDAPVNNMWISLLTILSDWYLFNRIAPYDRLLQAPKMLPLLTNHLLCIHGIENVSLCFKKVQIAGSVERHMGPAFRLFCIIFDI